MGAVFFLVEDTTSCERGDFTGVKVERQGFEHEEKNDVYPARVI